MKKASHKLGFLAATMAAMMGMGPNEKEVLDTRKIKREPSYEDLRTSSVYYANHQPAFIPSRSTVIKNKRRKIHNKRVKAK